MTTLKARISNLVSPETWAKMHSKEWHADQGGLETMRHWIRTQMIILVELSEYDVIRRVVVQGTQEASRLANWWAGHRGGATHARLDWELR